MAVPARIRRFLRDTFYVPEDEPIPDGASLVATGVVDSTGMLEVIAFLEAEFGIRIADDEATPENLDSVARIAAFVGRKRGSVAA